MPAPAERWSAGEERLARVRARRGAVSGEVELAALIARGRARRRDDERSDDEILGYDASGLPS